MKPIRFILIDDYEMNNLICRMFIEGVFPNVEIVDFLYAEDGLKYIQENYNQDIPIPTILFLDINMPIMDGWDFLEAYDKLDEEVKNNIVIYILSSSIDEKDLNLAANNKYVKRFLEKPLETEVIQKTYNENNFPALLSNKKHQN